jgi:hypothetical protein
MNITPADAFILFVAEAVVEIGGYLLIGGLSSSLAAAVGVLSSLQHRAGRRAWLWLIGSFAGLLTTIFTVPLAYFFAPALLVLTPLVSAIVAYGFSIRLSI